MSAAILEKPDTSDTGIEPEMFHLVCCDETIALCGEELDDADCRDMTSDDVPCVVCFDPALVCPTCGLDGFLPQEGGA